MAAEALVDLEGPPGAPRLVPAPATAAITAERSKAPTGWAFLTAVLLLALAAGAAAWAFGQSGGEVAAERTARPLVFGLADLGLAGARTVSAVSTAVLVGMVCLAGRNLSRSRGAGLFAGALVALDPATLAYGRLALPVSLTLALLAMALAAFQSHRNWMPWVGGLALLGAALVDPRAATWGLPLALVALLRGNIYAGPRHLGTVALQAGFLPLVGAGIHLLLEDGWAAVPACLAPGTWSQLTLHAAVQPGASILAQPGPVTWLVGFGALLFLGVGGALFAATRFRLARANGRLQLRLVSPMPTAFSRGLWLLALAAATLLPQAWLILFALALALGVKDLGEDAPGFGLALAIALLLFAALVLARSWGAITGLDGADGVADALGLVPWAEPSVC